MSNFLSKKNEHIKDVINKCLEDELILVRPAEESAKIYSVPYKKMLLIRRLVRYELGRKYGVDYLRKKDIERQVYQILRSLRNADIKYPGMIREIYEGGVLAAIGRKFGIRRQRVHQYKEKMETVIDVRGHRFMVNLIYKELPSSHKIKFNSENIIRVEHKNSDGKRKKRNIDILTEANSKYPGIIADIVSGDNKNEISKKFGITLQRIYQIESVINQVSSDTLKELIS